MYANGPRRKLSAGRMRFDALSARPDLRFDVSGDQLYGCNGDPRGSRDALTNKDETLYAKLSPEQHVTRDVPPIFLAHAPMTAWCRDEFDFVYEAC